MKKGLTNEEVIKNRELYGSNKLNEFKKVVKKSALKKEPHLITNYVYELATVFHSYYSEEKIVTDNEKYTYERIMLIKAVKIIIANSLNLIGVAPAERM